MAEPMSTVAERHRDRTRHDLLDAAVRLIVAGREPTMRAIAAEAGVGERTIYRYFENAEACSDAVGAFIGPRLGVPLCDRVDDLEDYARRLFDTFEENRELTVAFLRWPWSAPELERSRRANLEALHRLVRGADPEADDDAVASAVASLRTVLSGSGWLYQRVSCGLDQAQVIDNAVWLVRTTLAAIGLRPAGG